MPAPNNNTRPMLRRAARKWGARLYHWGNQPAPTMAVVYVVDFHTMNGNSSTNTPVTWHHNPTLN